MNTFKLLEKLLKKRYEIWEALDMPIEANKYFLELKELPDGTNFLNRKLALNYLVTKQLSDNIFYNAAIEEKVNVIHSELNNLGDIYNSRAMNLKSLVEVFPTSLMARYLGIKTVDFYR